MSAHHQRRVALITGGASGIGLGIATRLAEEGWSLTISGRRSKDEVADAVQALERRTDVLHVSADVSDADARSLLVAATLDRFGRIDALVNNAGIGSPDRLDILEATEWSFDTVIGVNLKGPYFLTQSVARQMIDQRGRGDGTRYVIVTISSVSATVASVNRGDYCIGKAGLAMANKLWAARLAEFDIDCFEVRPGIIATDMTSGVKSKYDELIAGGVTLERRWGTPDDVGRVVATVLRGDLPYSTGQVLVVDGGLTVDTL